jgi:hypothetical protein
MVPHSRETWEAGEIWEKLVENCWLYQKYQKIRKKLVPHKPSRAKGLTVVRTKKPKYLLLLLKKVVHNYI